MTPKKPFVEPKLVAVTSLAILTQTPAVSG